MNWFERRISVVSGGFDPLHSGHARLLLGALEHGPVHVILNSDAWLVRKKGQPFMSWDERAEIVRAIRGVVCVHHALDEDGTVVRSLIELRALHPRSRITFCNGGDRGTGTTPEESWCRYEGAVDLAFGVGGGKTQSSSALIERARGGLSRSPS
jgi:D-beta-D-heptose 7-phosphate kinase/D-beta-D-heptose 1-phosphate adenosyltransferase